MAKGIIRLCYRKIIDASSSSVWDKFVFDDTYQEFFMQAQSFNPAGRYGTFQELLANVPNADRLHQQTSSAAIGYIRQLNQQIPDVANSLGKLCLPFTQFRFEIIQSHVTDKSLHRIAILFYSDPLTWLDTLGNMLLIAYGDQRDTLRTGQEVPTDLIELRPYLSIAFVQYSSDAPTLTP